MTEQEILDGAPEGATHIDHVFDYWTLSEDKNLKSQVWLPLKTKTISSSSNRVCFRSLSDIQTIVDQQKQIDHLFEQVNEYAEKLADIRERLSTYNFLSVDEMIAAYEQQMRKIAEVSK